MNLLQHFQCSDMSIEWYKASNTNVCYLTYAFGKIPSSILKRLLYVRKSVKSHRLQYAAKVARDLVLNVRHHCIQMGGIDCWKDMSKLTVVGFSLGAHIASQTCINLFEFTGEKVGKLIGEQLTLIHLVHLLLLILLSKFIRFLSKVSIQLASVGL